MKWDKDTSPPVPDIPLPFARLVVKGHGKEQGCADSPLEI